MVSSSVTRASKSKVRKSRASKGRHEMPETSDAVEESATQANQVEDEEIAQEIQNTTSKLEELKGGDGGLDQWSKSFLKTLTEDKTRITEKLNEGKTAIASDNKNHKEALFGILGDALAPVVVGAAPIESNGPIRLEQVTVHGQALHQQSLLLLSETKVLLEVFNDLTTPDSVDSPLDKLTENFNQNRDYTENIIAAGRKVGQSDVEDMLADKYNEVRGRRTVSKDEEEMGQLVFNHAARGETDVGLDDSEGWGNVAYRAGKAAGRMEAVTVRQ